MRDIAIVRKDLETLKSTHFVTKWIMESTPYVFEGHEMQYILWREGIANALNIDPTDILISGSACLGFSLNPNKKFKPFDDRSDIDVCIVSSYYFDTAWRELLTIDQRSLQKKMANAVADHRTRLIYWGTIATDKILPLLSFGPSWDKIIRDNKTYDILKERDINFRVYKDRRSIRDYLVQGIEKSKEAIWEGE